MEIQIEEILTSLCGRNKLDENIQARLNVLLVDKIIDQDDYNIILKTIRHALLDEDIRTALLKYNEDLDTHLKEQTYKVLKEIYFL